MPGSNAPGRAALQDTIKMMQSQIAALQTQQQSVVTDPTKSTGDPAHGFATHASGYLLPITGLTGYGAAVWNGTRWVRVLSPINAGPAGSVTMASATPAALTSGPLVTIPYTGLYLVRFGGFMQLQAPGLSGGSFILAKNGVSAGLSASYVGRLTSDGSSASSEGSLPLVTGDVLSLLVNDGAVSTTFSAGFISAVPD